MKLGELTFPYQVQMQLRERNSHQYTPTARFPQFFFNKQENKMSDDVQALVIDNGSSMCKAGFAGDEAPR